MSCAYQYHDKLYVDNCYYSTASPMGRRRLKGYVILTALLTTEATTVYTSQIDSGHQYLFRKCTSLNNIMFQSVILWT